MSMTAAPHVGIVERYLIIANMMYVVHSSLIHPLLCAGMISINAMMQSMIGDMFGTMLVIWIAVRNVRYDSIDGNINRSMPVVAMDSINFRCVVEFISDDTPWYNRFVLMMPVNLLKNDVIGFCGPLMLCMNTLTPNAAAVVGRILYAKRKSRMSPYMYIKPSSIVRKSSIDFGSFRSAIRVSTTASAVAKSMFGNRSVALLSPVTNNRRTCWLQNRRHTNLINFGCVVCLFSCMAVTNISDTRHIPWMASRCSFVHLLSALTITTPNDMTILFMILMLRTTPCFIRAGRYATVL